MWLYGVLSILYTFYQNMVEATCPCTDAISSWQPEENCSIKLKYNSRLSDNLHNPQYLQTTVHVVDITNFPTFLGSLSNEQRVWWWTKILRHDRILQTLRSQRSAVCLQNRVKSGGFLKREKGKGTKIRKTVKTFFLFWTLSEKKLLLLPLLFFHLLLCQRCLWFHT